jgi:site-specific recombinase XerD
MTPIAPHITAFFQQRLPIERKASEHTCESYAYAFQLLFVYASQRLQVAPSALCFEQLDAPLIVDFLNDLETARGNSPRSRNSRLAAVKSFMRYMQYRLPAALEQIQRILAIPSKKTDIPLIDSLTRDELQSILDAPDPSTQSGIRDQAMLHLCFAGGLRVSELVGLCVADLSLQPQPTVVVQGKGRRQRALPLWKETARALRAWLATRGQRSVPELFPNARGQPMTRSGFEYILGKHLATASKRCPSLLQKRVSPHVLRHTCAMTVLAATKDLRRVALWLGHATTQTTEMYVRADAAVKLETIEAITPPHLRAGRFKATDKLLASLKSSSLCGANHQKRSPNQAPQGGDSA